MWLVVTMQGTEEHSAERAAFVVQQYVLEALNTRHYNSEVAQRKVNQQISS